MVWQDPKKGLTGSQDRVPGFDRAGEGGVQMNFKFEPRTVRMERLIGTASQQAVTEGSFDLPASLPAITRVVRVEAHPVVTGWEALENQVAVQGAVDLVLIYAHEEEAPASPAGAGDIEAEAGFDEDDILAEPSPPELREVLYRHRWRRAASFEVLLEVPGAGPQAAVEAWAEPETVDVELHSSGRRIDVEAVVTVGARATEVVTATAPVKGRAFPADAGASEALVLVEHVAGRSAASVSVDGVLALQGDGSCRRVLDVQATARATQAIAAPGEVTVAGVVDYRVLYVDGAGELRTAAWTEQTPFAHTFALAGAGEGTPVRTKARVSGVDALASDSGREIRVWTDVELSVAAARVEELPVVESLSGSETLEVRYRTAPLNLEEWVGAATHPAEAQGALELPQGHPPIDRVQTASARARVDDVLALEGKVVVEGRIDVDALYTARGYGQSLHAVSWTGALPFTVEVPLAGAEPGLEAEAFVQVEETALDLLNREAVEAQVRLLAEVRLTRPGAREAVVEAVAVAPPDPDPPTWTFVVLQEGDTLWKLSHRYHTDVARIVAANPWLEGADGPLPAGRKLCIPRRSPSAPASA